VSPRLQVVKPKAPDTKNVHTCSCGKTFTLTEWSNLAIVGFLHDVIPPEESGMIDDAGRRMARLEVLEQRNCTCGSTRALSIELPRVFDLANEQCKAVRRATSALVDAMRLRGDLPDRDPERTGPAELIQIEREACAQAAEKSAADLRLLANSRQGNEIKHSLYQRAELADEIAAAIRRRS